MRSVLVWGCALAVAGAVGCASEPAEDRPAEGAPAGDADTGRSAAPRSGGEAAGRSGGEAATPAAPPAAAASGLDATVDQALKELGERVRELGAAGEGLPQADGRLRTDLLALHAVSEPEPDLARCDARLRAGLGGAGLALGGSGRGLPLLLDCAVGEDAVALRLIDPRRERVVAVAVAGRTPPLIADALPELAAGLLERRAQGWGVDAPRVRTGRIVNKSVVRAALEQVLPWVERELIRGGLELGCDKRMLMEIEMRREEAEAEGTDGEADEAPTEPAAIGVTTHVLEGQLTDDAGKLVLELRLVSNAPPRVLLKATGTTDLPR